jgi:hypothetical protein
MDAARKKGKVMRVPSVALCSLILSLIPAAAFAQQCDLTRLPGLPTPGINTNVFEMAAWDPDGPGPAQHSVVVAGGGNLKWAGGTAVNSVARYDPATRQWFAMDSVANARQVIVGRNNELYVVDQLDTTQQGTLKRWNAGTWVDVAPARRKHTIALGGRIFAIESNNSVVEWNGTSWVSRGVVPSGAIRDLAADANDRLIAAGGGFTSISGVPVVCIAVFDGANWSSIVSGLFTAINEVGVAPDGTLYAFGTNNSGSRWARRNGATWTDLGSAIARENPRFVFGPTGDIFLRSDADVVQRWNGSAFVPFAGYDIAITPANLGLVSDVNLLTGPQPYLNVADYRNGVLSPAIAPGPVAPRILDFLRLPNGNIIAAGEFSQIEGVPAANLALWNGQSWTQFAGGTNGPVSRAFLAPDGRIVIQGSFTQAGNLPANGVAFWNGTAWSTIAISNPSLYVAVDGAGTIFATVTGAGQGLYRNDNGTWVLAGPYADQIMALQDGDVFGVRSGVNTYVPSRWTGTQWTTIFATTTRPAWAQLADGSLLSVSTAPLRIAPPLNTLSTAVPFENASITELVSVEPAGPGRDLLVGRFTINAQQYSVVLFDGVRLTPLIPSTGNVTAAALDAAGHLFVAGDFHTLGDNRNTWRFGHYILPDAACNCDDIDFNNNDVFPEEQDVIDFFNVLAGADCPACNDIDFNNNNVFPEEQDVISFFNVLAGGPCN